VAFLLDGRPAYKRPTAPEAVPVGTDDAPAASSLEWFGDEALAFLTPRDGGAGPYSLSVFRDGEDAVPVAENVTDIAPGAGGVLAAVNAAPEDPEEPAFRVVFVGPDGGSPRLLPGVLPGRVSGLSVAPDGARAVLAAERDGRWEVWILRLNNGALRRLTSLPEGVEVLGAPQLTPRGAYFVAGEAGAAEAGSEPASYALYQVRRTAASDDAPELVQGVGEGFIAAAVRASPDGESLAVLGRRSPTAPVELYVLDLGSGSLRTATRNEDMEVRTGPGDLAWTPDGRAVVLIARGSLSGPETYNGPASELHAAFFNLYEVPVVGEAPASAAGRES